MGLFDRFKKKKPAEEPARERDEDEDDEEEEEDDEEEEEAAQAEPRPAVAGKPDGSEWYRCGDVVIFGVGEDKDAVYSADAREVHVLPEFVTGVLRRCTTFETLDDHVTELAAALRMGVQEQAALRRHLQTLAQKGLLRSHHDLVARARTRDRAPAPPAISVVGVIGKPRESLARVLEGAGRDVVTVDAAERARVRDRLRGVGGEWVDLALESDRNALLLRTAGRMCLIVDGAATGRAGQPAEREDGLSMSSTVDPTQPTFHRDVDEACRSIELGERDLVAAYAKLLGRSLAACVAAHDTGRAIDLDLDDASGDLLHRYVNGLGRVIATVAGVCGDSGMRSPGPFLMLRGDARDRWIAEYATHRTTRAVVRAAPRATVTEMASLVAPCVGLDARDVLPPFFPGAEGAYGALVAATLPHGCVGHVPLALEHRPEGVRAFQADDLVAWARDFRLSDVVGLCAKTLAPGASTLEAAERVRSLGRHLRSLAALDPEDFAEYIRIQRAQQLSHRASWLSDSLRLYDAPDDWVEDVEQTHAAVIQEISTTRTPRPNDVDAADPLSAARTRVDRYGELCLMWPDLWGHSPA